MAYQRVPKAKRAAIISTLCEGMAINSVCRVFNVGKAAVMRVIEETGAACEDWHDKHFVGLKCERLELDEQWNFVHTHKERMSKEEKRQNPERGDCWLWAAIDPDSKAIIGWRTGKRSAGAARDFAHDLARRVPGHVQITSDQLQSYGFAVPAAFKGRVDYAQEHKIFQAIKVDGPTWQKYRVSPLVGVERHAITGAPDLLTSTVCHMERFFLTMRQSNKRCARKTLAYSKKWDNHALMASIYNFVYNLVRKHESTKTTPAMRLGIEERRWTLEDVVDMADAHATAQEEMAFESAFESDRFKTKPSTNRTFKPTPKHKLPVPWYLKGGDGVSESP